ncbi:MAG: hypothetical protein KDD45_16140, partial [Bdellovibrionales bacterium]|nr:hypothetical protein [Bdellovibrionales bacterium]
KNKKISLPDDVEVEKLTLDYAVGLIKEKDLDGGGKKKKAAKKTKTAKKTKAATKAEATPVKKKTVTRKAGAKKKVVLKKNSSTESATTNSR